MAVVGYARVSRVGQSLDVQLEKLKGCDKGLQGKALGCRHRPPSAEAISRVPERRTRRPPVTKIDRLARSTSDLHRIVSELGDKGVSFKVLDDPSIDTKSRTGKLVMGILALIAEFENDIRRERQMDGIAKAKDRGVKFGRKLQLLLKEWSKYKISGLEVLRCRTSFSGPASARRASIEPWGAESLSWA